MHYSFFLHVVWDKLWEYFFFFSWILMDSRRNCTNARVFNHGTLILMTVTYVCCVAHTAHIGELD